MKAMQYETMPVKPVKIRTSLVKQMEVKALDKVGSGRILLYLVKKHQVGLLESLVVAEFVLGILRHF